MRAIHLRKVVVEPFAVGFRPKRIGFRKDFLYAPGCILPEGHVEPDMGVVVALKQFRIDQVLLGNAFFGHGEHGDAALPHPLEHVGHFSFQMQAVVQDHVGSGEAVHVSGACLVQVRVHARPHEAGRRYVVAAYLRGQVRQHAGGGDDAEAVREGCVVAVRLAAGSGYAGGKQHRKEEGVRSHGRMPVG